jgi:alpha-galactosidase
MTVLRPLLPLLISVILAGPVNLRALNADDNDSKILTPPAPPTPRINGPSVFGVRPGAPFLYTIPTTGDRPMKFSVDNLPAGLTLDADQGRITGSIAQPGETDVVFHAQNAKGMSDKKFRIIVGDQIALTPPMGWNSWNCWAGKVDQDKVLISAKAMADSGLINHGWTYVNIDDTWQGKRTGPNHALEGNEKFPDIGKLSREVHDLGLKIGIYSTPWITSYGQYPGGGADNPDGTVTKKLNGLGPYTFEDADAKQWAAWGIDYLKYDWDPIDVPHTEAMSKALRASGRDIVFSLSNAAPFEHAADWARLANCWRTTGDIWDQWQGDMAEWSYSVSAIAFSQDRWVPFAGPGHWNDPDMLVVGRVGWGDPHLTHLTADEQYSHISMWCLLSAPLLIGCDMSKLSPFTLNLLTNDEVLALDQDALGHQAQRVATEGPIDIYRKDLEDGAHAVGFFNRDSHATTFYFDKMPRIGMAGKLHFRDLWRQKDLPPTKDNIVRATIPAHGVLLLKVTSAP